MKCFAVDIDGPRLFAVCDGMGGHSAGEVASLYVARALAADAKSLADVSVIMQRLVALNDELFDKAEREPATCGMGTTVAGLLLCPDRTFFFNVGDSRIYRLQNGYLRQLSVDDSRSLLLEEEPHFGCTRENWPGSSAISQAIGGALERIGITPHVGCETLYPASRYLICSDGLTDLIDIDSMEACLRSADDLTAVNELLMAALNNGGADNVSIILIST